jgi:hypothetical protein
MNHVNAFNYVRAKTALQFGKYYALAGGINRFSHRRDVVDVTNRTSKRLNRDTLYSVAIVDISKGATVTLPDAGDRYLTLQVVNEDGFTNRIFHGAGRYGLTVEEFDTPFVWLLVRTLVFDSIPGDVEEAHALQDQVTISSVSDRPYSHPNYDQASFEHTNKLLVELAKDVTDNAGAAGSKDDVDPIRQLLVTAYGFGTLPESESFLVNVQPDLPSDGAYALRVKDVPVDGFWSLAMYDKEGYFNPNPYEVYGFGDRSAKKSPDGSITLHFGGDPNSVNFIPLSDGWNYVIRLYRPRKEILDSSWTFPEVQPID